MSDNAVAELAGLVKNLRTAVSRTMIDLIRARQKIYALETEIRLRTSNRSPRFPIEFRSQFGEDLLVWDLFAGQTQGLFIEAGAFDGYHYSVTYALEAIGWNGLLVEPHPQAVEQCVRRRPNSTVVYAALSDRTEASAEFTIIHDQYGGMLSHLGPDTSPERASAAQTSVKVPVTSLNELLRDHRGEVDLVVLDVEGAEVKVLAGFDLNRFRPRMLLIEANDPPSIKQAMASSGYITAGGFEPNLVFIRPDQKEMLERLRWLLTV